MKVTLAATKPAGTGPPDGTVTVGLGTTVVVADTDEGVDTVEGAAVGIEVVEASGPEIGFLVPDLPQALTASSPTTAKIVTAHIARITWESFTVGCRTRSGLPER